MSHKKGGSQLNVYCRVEIRKNMCSRGNFGIYCTVKINNNDNNNNNFSRVRHHIF